MIKQSLNGIWNMTDHKGEVTSGIIPGSVYSFLLDAGKMEDPFYRDNELDALKLVENDYTFRTVFQPGDDILKCQHQTIVFEGIDTLAEVFLNGSKIGSANNFHRTWEYDVKGVLKEKDNELVVKIASPTKYIEEKDREYHVGGSTDAMRGFPYLRKAHCMFGWDWGPRLPDEGIWRDVTVTGWNRSRITDIQIRQEHPEKNSGPVLLRVNVTQSGESKVEIILVTPDGERMEIPNGEVYTIKDPQRWWPNGLGKQPLYTVEIALVEDGQIIEKQTKRIGLRTMQMRRIKDEWGQSFAHEVNGQTFFAMGADYIPEDNILSRRSKERTKKLLQDCIEAHFNVIRVWGGGCYPDDYFYDLCDELGLVVWQDMMFACANYKLDDEFVDNITEEMTQNVRRLRHHASLGLWCGNNEMESFAKDFVYDGNLETRRDYLIQAEFITPRIVAKEDPDTFYWPSSPSSGGAYDEPGDPNRGDVHYWSVWHGGVPFTEYRKYFFRYLSEFGFQSFPELETVKTFTKPEDRNIFSRVMEMHQRNASANGKILEYMSQTYLYPCDFSTLLYASQLLQAEAIRYGVEHFRRNRNGDRCMGAVYWQLNDIWPVASWASIDYFGRWKALHYFAKRFFAPVMISCEEVNEITVRDSIVSQPSENVSTAKLCVTNETWDTVSGTVEWSLRDANSNVLQQDQIPVLIEPFSSLWLDQMDFSDTAFRENHLYYRFVQDGKEISSGSVLFTAPKHYEFKDPNLSISRNGDEITVTADAYAKSVEIYKEDGLIRLDDNFFDMEKGSKTVKITAEEGNGKIVVRSVYDIR